MKSIAKSAGLAALGLLGVAAANAQTPYGLAPKLSQQELSKTWSVSAVLRGFYDDNYNTAPKGLNQSSVGFEVSPSASINFPMEQTYIGFNVLYSLRYYADRPVNSADHTFQVNAILAHAFSERFKLDVTDNFVVSQEPELLDPGTVTTPIRTEGNNLRNKGSIDFTTGLTPKLSAVWGYANTYYDYEQDAKSVAGPGNLLGAGSRSALLDRMEHLFSANGRWVISPATVGVVGYQYGISDYSSKDLLTTGLLPGDPNNQPQTRDNRSHYGFVGADHSFTAQLTGSIRAGIQSTEYPNLATSSSEISPYFDGSISWAYSPGSSVMGGARHQRSATDVAYNVAAASPTLDAENTVFYAAVNHQLTANFTVSLLGQVQFSTFNSGGADNFNEMFFTLGLNVAYRINQFLSAEAGYNFDKLNSSDLDASTPRSFDRNRVYIGLRATY